MNDVKYIIVNKDGDILFRAYNGKYMFGTHKILTNLMFDSEAQAQNWAYHNSKEYGDVPVNVVVFVRKKRNDNG